MQVEIMIRRLLQEIVKIDNAEDISVDYDLKESGMDSLNAIELVVALEIEFNIQFSEEDLLLNNLCSIQKLVYIVNKCMKER